MIDMETDDERNGAKKVQQMLESAGHEVMVPADGR